MCPNAMYYLCCYCDNIYIYIYYNPACMIAVYTFINVSKFIPLSYIVFYRFVDFLCDETDAFRVGEENAPYNAAIHNAICC